MGEDGKWRLSPAYDMGYAYNPLVGVGPKRWRAGGDDQRHCKHYAIEYLDYSFTSNSSRGCHNL